MPYKKSYRRPRRKIMRRRAVKPRVSKTVKRYVKKAISASAENKFTITRAVNQSVSTAVGTTPYSVSLLPSLSVSAARHGRSGNSIRVKNLSIQGRVNLLPYNATTNPIACPVAVKIWILSVTAYREIGAFSGSVAATGFFDEAAAPTGFAGNTLDLISRVSKDFKVYASKTIQLGCTSATNNFASTSVGAFDNSKFSAGYYFNISKHFKMLRYNDTSSASICENRNCWIVMQPVALDGTATGTAIIENHYNIVCEFEDM